MYMRGKWEEQFCLSQAVQRTSSLKRGWIHYESHIAGRLRSHALRPIRGKPYEDHISGCEVHIVSARFHESTETMPQLERHNR